MKFFSVKLPLRDKIINKNKKVEKEKLKILLNKALFDWAKARKRARFNSMIVAKKTSFHLAKPGPSSIIND